MRGVEHDCVLADPVLIHHNLCLLVSTCHLVAFIDFCPLMPYTRLASAAPRSRGAGYARTPQTKTLWPQEVSSMATAVAQEECTLRLLIQAACWWLVPSSSSAAARGETSTEYTGPFTVRAPAHSESPVARNTE